VLILQRTVEELDQWAQVLFPSLIEAFDADGRLTAPAKKVLEKWFRQRRSNLFLSGRLGLSDIDRG
jgi:hypothetical protein